MGRNVFVRRRVGKITTPFPAIKNKILQPAPQKNTPPPKKKNKKKKPQNRFKIDLMHHGLILSQLAYSTFPQLPSNFKIHSICKHLANP